jgi:HPt (histidine-containing phosphotransfer) domain-containing protein
VKAGKANKARAQAVNAVAQLEMAMELEDALKQNSARRSDAPRLVKKVPRQKLGADRSGQEHPGMPRYDSITRQILMDLLMIN